MNQNQPQNFYNQHFAKKCLKMDYLLTIFIGLFLTLQSDAQIVTTTFNYTGDLQTFTVPVGVTSITVDVLGAKAGNNNIYSGGNGGRVQAVIPVTPGEVLNIYVGQLGVSTSDNNPTVYNGGGGVFSYISGGSAGTGGGASDIRRSPYTNADRLIVAGGGGGAGYQNIGGHGGGLVGQDGVPFPSWPNSGGKGGTQSMGGAGGVACCLCPTYTTAGAFFQGGNGAGDGAGGGGGGGGYYGGGGSCFAGGGGGSSYTASGVTGVTHTQGINTGSGQVIISYIACPTPPAYTLSYSGSPYCSNNGTTQTPVLSAPVIDGVLDASGRWGGPVSSSDDLVGWPNDGPTNPFGNNVNVNDLYVTSDAQYVYFGATINSAADWQSWGFAINTIDGSGGSSEVWNFRIGYGHAQLPDFVVKGHFGRGGAPYAQLVNWNGSSWTGFSDLSGADFRAEETGMVEVRILKSALGNPSDVDVQFYISGNNEFEHATFDAVPDDQVATAWNHNGSGGNPPPTILDTYANNIQVNGTFSATPAGITVNAATGAFIPSATTPGTYTISYTIPSSNGCPAQTASTMVTVTTLPTANISYSGSPFCKTITNVTVTQTGTTGGVYSSSPAGLNIDAMTGTINPAASTANTYTVTYTIAAGGGCAAITATTMFTITALPTANISYSGTPFCTSVTIGAVTQTGTTGGVYSSSPSGLSINAMTGVINPGASLANTYTVTYTIAAGGGCTAVTASTMVTITALPEANIVYTGQICGSGTLSVSQTGASGGSYSFSPTGLSINAMTGEINQSASTPNTYTVTYSIPAGGGCNSVSAITTVILRAPLSLSTSITPSCIGGSTGIIDLTVSGGNPIYTYDWSNDGPETPDNDPQDLTGLASGTYTVTVTDGNACMISTSASVSQSSSSIVLTTTTVQTCEGGSIGSINLTVSGGTPGYTYDWSNDGPETPDNDPKDLIGLNAGQYTVTVTDAGGCTAVTSAGISTLPLPCGWSAEPNGVGCTAGNSVLYNNNNQRFTVTSTNCYYPNSFTNDALAFAQYDLCGNGSITAQVTSITPLGQGWAGVTMRENNAAGAKKAQLMTNLSNLSRREFRTTTNGQAYPQQFPSQNRYWLRITRTGNQFAMYISQNGTSWSLNGTQTIVMGNCIEVGLVVTNYTANSTVTANFANVNVTGGNITKPTINAQEDILAAADFTIMPNPTTGIISLDLSSYGKRQVRLDMYNLQGKLLRSINIESFKGKEEVDLTTFASGMYLIRVRAEGLPDVTKRVVVNGNY